MYLCICTYFCPCAPIEPEILLWGINTIAYPVCHKQMTDVLLGLHSNLAHTGLFQIYQYHHLDNKTCRSLR